MTAPEVASLDKAIAEVRLLLSSLRSPLRWGLIEGRLAACDSAAQVVAAFETLPEGVSVAGLSVGTEGR
jgi:hypothetical protein